MVSIMECIWPPTPDQQEKETLMLQNNQVAMLVLNDGNGVETNLYISQAPILAKGFVVFHAHVVYADIFGSKEKASFMLDQFVSLELNNEERIILHKTCNSFMLRHNLKTTLVGFAMKSCKDGSVTPYAVIEFKRLSGNSRLHEELIVKYVPTANSQPVNPVSVEDRLLKLSKLVNNAYGFITLDYVASAGVWTMVVSRSSGECVTNTNTQPESVLTEIEKLLGLVKEDGNGPANH